ncbi:hypothetical protein ABC345_03035 [Shouchella sp. 1P09AA]|uniref:hypothetical protein n=1 Tax=unclassified Shouchella TaxID=2893065 RepID=UPI0039A2EB56
MKAFMKTGSAIMFSAALLSACGSGEETANGNEAERTGNETEVGNPNSTSGGTNGETDTDEENEEEQETSSDDDAESEEEPVEIEFDPAEEGEEREAGVTKQDQYMQGGVFTGGEMKDATMIGNMEHGIHEGFERLVLDLHEWIPEETGEPKSVPSSFEVTKEAYPSRLVYSLQGLRAQPSNEDLPNLESAAYYSSMAITPIFDDTTVELAAYLQDSTEFEVYELHEPAKIVTDVRAVDREEDYAPVFSLRTASISEDGPIEQTQGPEMAFMEEGSENVRIVHSADSTLFVEEDYYFSLEEAEEKKEALENDGFEYDLFIEERGMFDVPENIEE